MDMKHTPGPHRAQLCSGPGHWQIIDESCRQIGLARHWPDKHGANTPEAAAETQGNAVLWAAAPDLLAAQTMGAQVDTPAFLEWLADRLVHVYKENPNVDFVLSLRSRAAAGRAAINKAKGIK
jgi:hypothetical protein